MPLYRFIYERKALEVNATSLGVAYSGILENHPETGKLLKVECGVEPFTKPRTLFVEEEWDEWYYRLEIDQETEHYSEVVYRLWINSKIDGTGYWIEMPHNYASGKGNAAALVEKYSDLYWAGAPND